MTGALVYDSAGYARNKWFADELIKCAKEHGMELRLVIAESGDGFFCDGELDFAIVRVISPEISRYFESLGIPVYNNYKTSYIANNKWRTYQLALELGIPVMKTYLPSDTDGEIPFPAVVKSFDGHGGAEVFMAKNSAELTELSHKMKGGNYLIQECCSEVGRDVRVYCMGEKILLAVLRESDSDFRSNFSLGGRATVFEPNGHMRETVKKLYDALGFSLVGVDFISHGGRWVLNEIEDVVGTRMIYSCTDMDIVELYISYIAESICGRKKEKKQ